MLTDRLRVFYDAVNIAVARHGKNAPAIARDVIDKAFPDTAESAEREGADAMLRVGVIAKVKQVLTQQSEDTQSDFCVIDDGFLPIVRKLSSHSHYVPSAEGYIHVGVLINNQSLFEEARQFKRQKGQETLAEADVLDELYEAVFGA